MKISRMVIPFLAFAASGFAQLAAPNESGVSMGHLHLYTKDPAAETRFWTEILGAPETKASETRQLFKIPGVLIVADKVDPTAGTDGSVVNHVAFKVKDLSAMLTKMEAAHFTIVSRNPPQAMVMASDDLKVEFTEDAALEQPVVFHHIHFYAPAVPEMQKWYAATFGAVPGKRGRFEADDLPGVNLTFAPAPGAVAGTNKRALDHIGFEVKGLEAFTKKLADGGMKFDLTYRQVPSLGIAIAFITDPWGTKIELTEGLSKF
ncbi:MAG TPA: VOC family protein [Bryobacteraceae bacterium]|nr:VOC family protein [Bryobacteraceae bacterium]